MQQDFKLYIAELVANQIRRDTFEGREHLVAPVVAVVEKVLNDELLPAEEIVESLIYWEGVPVPIEHPVNELGEHVSANGRDVLEAQVVGRFWNVVFDEEGAKLKGEIWIDLEKAGKVERGREAVERLERAERGDALVEVSTAYFRELEMMPGEFAGVNFEGVQRNIRPDHLALLLDSVGACSVADGCGTPRTNKEEDVKANVRGTARRPSFQGTEDTAWTGPTLERMIRGWVRHGGGSEPESMRIEDLPRGAKNWIASKSLLGDPAAENSRDLFFFPVVNPDSNRLNARALRAVLGGRGSQAQIPASARESAQNMARRLLESQFESSQNSLGTALKVIGRALGFNSEETMKREQLIAALVAFACCPLSKESLEALTDDELQALHDKAEAEAKAAEEAANAEADASAEAGADDGGDGTTEGDAEPAAASAEPAITDEDRELLKTLREIGGDRLKEIKADGDKERADAIATLEANERCSIPKEDLEKMPTSALVALSKDLAPVDYSGAGGPFITTHDADGVPEAPAIITASEEK